MNKRFIIKTVNEHGQVHYAVTDLLHNRTVTCDCNELNSTLNEMMGEE